MTTIIWTMIGLMIFTAWGLFGLLLANLFEREIDGMDSQPAWKQLLLLLLLGPVCWFIFGIASLTEGRKK